MMLVDCQTCPVRDVRCADCVVTALTAIPLRPGAPLPRPGTERRGRTDGCSPRPQVVAGRLGDAEALTAPLDRTERRAVSAFLVAGLVTAATANAARAELEAAEMPHRARSRRAV